MKSFLILGISSAICFFQVGCASKNKVEMGGVPGWLQGGAKLSDEPEPEKFDAAILEFEEESGPIEFRLNTDKRKYDAPPAPKKKASQPTIPNLGERNRDSRIKRLVR